MTRAAGETKPHIWLGRSCWVCTMTGTRPGFGFTPATAFREWLVRNGGAA